MALETYPTEASGLMSGVLQQGYSLGYLLVAVFNLTSVPKHGWQILFYIGVGGNFTIGLTRYVPGAITAKVT
jgi:MFS transporter, SHS family, lactate transporter